MTSTKVPQENSNHDDVTAASAEEENNSFFHGVSFNQMISAVGIIVSLVGLYLKRDQLMSAFQTLQNKESSSPRPSPGSSQVSNRVENAAVNNTKIDATAKGVPFVTSAEKNPKAFKTPQSNTQVNKSKISRTINKME